MGNQLSQCYKITCISIKRSRDLSVLHKTVEGLFISVERWILEEALPPLPHGTDRHWVTVGLGALCISNLKQKITLLEESLLWIFYHALKSVCRAFNQCVNVLYIWASFVGTFCVFSLCMIFSVHHCFKRMKRFYTFDCSESFFTVSKDSETTSWK